MTYISIGGTERPILFGMAALYTYEQRTGRKALSDFAALSSGPQEAADDPSLMFLVDLIFSGLAAGARKTGLAVDFIAEDVAEWVGNDLPLIERVMRLFVESFPDAKKKEAQPASAAKPKPKPR